MGRGHRNRTQHIKLDLAQNHPYVRGRAIKVMCCCILALIYNKRLYISAYQTGKLKCPLNLQSSTANVQVLCIWLECSLFSLWDKAYNVPETMPLYKVWSDCLFWDGAQSFQSRSKCLCGWWDQLDVVGDISGWVVMLETGPPFPALSDVL